MKRSHRSIAHAEPSAIRSRRPDPDGIRNSSVAFITYGERLNQHCSTNHDQRSVRDLVQKALQAGAIIVNILQEDARGRGARPAKWIDSLLRTELEKAWTTYNVRTIGSVMSFFSTSDVTLESEKAIDPDIGLQALMLTFRAPTGLLCIINESLPTFPSTRRQGLLNCYADAAAKYNADHILIGGASHNSVVVMENQVSQVSLDFEFFSLKRLYLLAHAADENPLRCYDLDSSEPYSLVRLGLEL